MNNLRKAYIGVFIFFIAVLMGVMFHFNGNTGIGIHSPLANVRATPLSERELLLTGSNGLSYFELGWGRFDITAHIYENGNRVSSQILVENGHSSRRSDFVIGWEFSNRVPEAQISWGYRNVSFREGAAADSEGIWMHRALDLGKFEEEWFGSSSTQPSLRIRRGEERQIWMAQTGSSWHVEAMEMLRRQTSFGDHEPHLESFPLAVVITVTRH